MAAAAGDLYLRARAELEVMRIRKGNDRLPWRDWLAQHFASYTFAPFADRHVRFWEWITSLEPGVRPRPRVEIWPRGGAKSSTIELACTYLGSQPNPVRHYVLYVSETQAQANKHVQSIASMLERVGVRRAVNEYGSSRGWRHEEIRTANNFNITAFGLDSGMRGVKLDEYRPDIIIFDDVDGRHDTPATTQKKIDVITTTVLPAGSSDVATVIVQNKIHVNSIVSQLADDRADFLHDRIPATVEPAVHDLSYQQVIREDGTPHYEITGGTPTWEGQNLKTCEQQLNEWGVNAFLREAQHEVEVADGGLWDKARDITPFRASREDLPEFDVTVVAIDPNVEEGGDAAGIVVAGVSHYWNDFWWDHTHGYVLADRTVELGPKAWLDEAIATAEEFRADYIVAEVNNGGELVVISLSTVEGADRFPVNMVRASKGKLPRATPVQKLYEDGRVHHLGTFVQLEKELCTWRPQSGQRSPNRLDAVVWAITDLMLESGGRMHEPTGALRQYLARQ